MKRITFLAAIIAGFFVFGAQSAFAVNDFCNFVTATECQVTTAHAAVNGAFTIDRTLHIYPGGSLTTSGGAALTITITPSGDFLMDGPAGPAAGALISGDFATGTGSAITITLADGDVDMAPGSIIRSNGKSGGAIKITTTATHIIDIDGLVESVGSVSGTGAVQAPGGGTITIVAGCELTVSDDGKISSRGLDPGADLVHLEGCTVVIDGLVESTGTGHALPNNPANHCNLDPAAHPLGGASFFDACVEIWGNTVTINSILPHKGEVSANGPRNPGRGWIDVFSRGDITINNDTVGLYSVHANSATAVNTNSFGGLITVKSSVGKFTASGFAIQANGTGGGSNGGDVIVQAGGALAAGDVAFGTALIQATGPNGSNTAGGHISARSFNGSLTGAAPGTLNAAGGLAQAVPVPGTVLLEACVNDPGPVAGGYNGTVTGTRTNHGPGGAFCGGNPTFPVVAQWSTGVSATQFIANAADCATTRCGGTCTKSGLKFNDVNGNHVRNLPEDVGLPGWTITLWNSTQTAIVAVPGGNPVLTDASGNYLFAGLAPDTYVVCESPMATWNQTFPQAGAGIVACTNGTLGYQFTLSFDVNNCTDTGNDFGNNRPSHKSGMKFNDLDGQGDKDPGDPGISGWPINLYKLPDLVNVFQTVNTGAGGTYSFTILEPGDYQACEGQKAGATSSQTFPNGTTVHAGETIVSDCPGPNIWGYRFTVAAGDNLTDDDFGNHTDVTCTKQTAIDIMDNAFPGNLGPDITVKAFAPSNESVQDAVDDVTDLNGDGYLIIMVIAHANGSLGGTVPQKVVVDKDYFNDPNPDIGNKPFGLFGCSVTMTGGGETDPAIWIQTTAQGKETTINGHKSTVLVADLHGGNSKWGLVAEGTERYIRNEQPTGNGIGIVVSGDGNTVHNGVVQNSATVGLEILGNNNFVTDTRVYTSGTDGVVVSGDNNELRKMLIGDIGKGNGGDGLLLGGNGNVLQENTARSNTKDGFHIVVGTGNTLKKNISGGSATQNNGDCEFDVADGNTDLGENKANGVLVVDVVPGVFPTGCIGSP
jgi:parallel beta-helix repeat protein